MTYFIAVSDLNSGNEFDLYSADTFDAVCEQVVIDLGGHPAISEGVVSNRSGFGGAFVREGNENADFWHQVMDDVLDGRDNKDWFVGVDRADVVAKAVAFHGGEPA